MNEELKAKWVAALRSGEYKQTTGTYVTYAGDRYCCLGVLVKLARQDDPDISISEAEHSCATSTQIQKLITMNDDGSTFAEIANWIEKNL